MAIKRVQTPRTPPVATLTATDETAWRTRWLLQRALAAVYAIAFLVAIEQFGPLLGSRGLTPVPFYLAHTSAWSAPSLFFVHYTDGLASACAWIGLACAVLALAGL